MQQLVFITGSTGLVGGHLLVQLHLKRFKIKALVRKTSSFEQLKLISDFYNVSFNEVIKAVDWVYGDTLDYIGLQEALKGVKTIYHCAAMVSFGRKNRETLLKTNIRGTANMVDAAVECGVGQFCFISSIAALGSENETGFIDETTPRDINKPVSVYSESKFLSELEVWRGAAEGLNVVILNPGVILGPGLPNKGSMLLFQAASKGIPFYTDSVTGYIDVRDICRAAIDLISREIYGKRFVLVSENVDNMRLFTDIAQQFGKKGPSVRAGKGLLNIAIVFAELLSLFTKKDPPLSKDTIRTVTHPEYYSSQLIKDTIHFSFTPISETIHDTSLFLINHLKERQKKTWK